MKKIYLVLFIILALQITPVYSSWTPAGKVEYLHTWGAGFSFIVSNATHDCGSGGNQFFVPWSFGEAANRLYSLVMLSFTTGKLLAANYYCEADGSAYTGDIDIR